MERDANLFLSIRNKPDPPNLRVGDHVLQCVSSHNFLGLVIQDDLILNEHIAMLLPKHLSDYTHPACPTAGKNSTARPYHNLLIY